MIKKTHNSYTFGDLTDETVPLLMDLCNDDEKRTKWHTNICFDHLEYAPRLRELIYPHLTERSNDDYHFSGKVYPHTSQKYTDNTNKDINVTNNYNYIDFYGFRNT